MRARGGVGARARGARPIVIEREPLVGGLCATHARTNAHGTWRFDLGGHRFVSSSAALSRWLESLVGDDLLTQERRSVVLHEGRRFQYPLDARDLVANLGWRENARALAGYAVERARSRVRPRGDVTFEDWVVARFGRPLYDAFFGPYTEKLWGIPPTRISADWAAERISLLSLGDAALRMMGLRTRDSHVARRYLYPRFGMGQIYHALAREVERLGGEVRTGTRLVAIETKGDRAIAVRTDGRAGRQRIALRELLSTIALPDLARALHPHAPAASTPRRARSFPLAHLPQRAARPARRVARTRGCTSASGGLRISRIQEPKRRSPSMAPPGRTSMMLEIPCDVGDDVWTSDVAALRHLASRELDALDLSIDDALDAFVVRVEHGYPVYHVGYDTERRALLGAVDAFANVRTAGRQGLFATCS